MLDFIQRYNVGRRLAIAFSLLIVLTTALVGIGVASMHLARSELDNIAQDNMQKIKLAQEMMDANSILSVELRNLVLPTDSSEKAGFKKIIRDQRLRYDPEPGAAVQPQIRRRWQESTKKNGCPS